MSSDLSPVAALTAELIRCPSVTPDDAGCQAILRARLEPLGFACETLQFEDVTNLFARLGTEAPLTVFLGHTDVVSPGPLEAWTSPPFEPEVRDGQLYGRGSADMKGGLAAFVVAVERWLASGTRPRGSIGLLITSDEEGRARHGTKQVMETLAERGVTIDHCLVGEPSSLQRLGDTVRVGRRGSLRGDLEVHGIQGHTAYPHLADNPIHALAPALAELCARTWDEGNDHFPPTTFQISNLNAGTGVTNVIPGALTMSFNFRFGTASTREGLEAGVAEILARHGVNHTLSWHLSGAPFLTPGGALVEAVLAAVEARCGEAPVADTGGGTSDGRFVAPYGAEVVELGPVNASIHKVDEHVDLADLETLAAMYEGILERLQG